MWFHGAESPVRGAQEQVGNGECLDVVVVVLEARFVEHKTKLEVVSALMWLSWCRGAQSPVRGAQEQVGSGECLDVVVAVSWCSKSSLWSTRWEAVSAADVDFRGGARTGGKQ